jgi:GAF domain-containing protein
VRAHERLMPTETPLHPAARAVGGARTQGRVVAADPAATAGAVDARASEEVLGVTSLARAVAGEASVADVGALCWMMLKSMLPCAAIGLFVPDERNDTVVGRYAAGSHSGMLRNLCTPTGDGVVGWVAAHRRTAVNAEPAIDFGPRAASLDPPLRSSLAIPLVHEATLVAVLVIYASAEGAFTDDHGRLMDLLAPKLAASLAYTTRSPRQVLHEGFSTEGSPRRVLHEGSSRRVLRGRF